MRVIIFDSPLGAQELMREDPSHQYTVVELRQTGGGFTHADLRLAVAVGTDRFDAVVIGHQLGDGQAVARAIDPRMRPVAVVAFNAPDPVAEASRYSYAGLGYARFGQRFGSADHPWPTVHGHLAAIAAAA